MHKFYIAAMIILVSSNIPLICKSKERPVCPVTNKLIKDMDVSELQLMLEYAKKLQDHDLVYKCFYHIINKTADHEKIRVYKLQLADYCFSVEEFEKAGLKYQEFVMLYPGSKEAEYASYKYILCIFYQSLSHELDQTDTHKTINLISVFLTKATNQQFIDEVKTIHVTCRQRLLEHEVMVFATYLRQQKFGGAKQRLEYIEKNFTDIEKLSEYMKYLQALYDRVENPKTRPFVFTVKLEDALIDQSAQPTPTAQDLTKTVSYFVA